MGCCCSKRRRNSSAFGGEGNRLGTADEQRDARAARAAAAEERYTDQQPYTDDRLTDDERAKIRGERLAAAEGRLTKQEKKVMKTKKKPSSEPLRGPNSKNTMTWTAG
ncbi:hypothetical protein ACHAXR_007955 [Thalassiosira sp. AJA248-18]